MRASSHTIRLGWLVLAAAVLLLPVSSEAQRMQHSAPKARKPEAGKAAAASPRSINGGAQRSESRAVPKAPAAGDRSMAKESVGKGSGAGSRPGKGGTTKVGNKVNIDNSQKNVNINVDNSKDVKIRNERNTRVRASSRHYGRPPHVYGGHRYYCHGPYFYHPYRPYYWGPTWHPWGFFVASLTATAIVMSIDNQQYHYDQGVYYVASSGGYTVVQAPVGATITTLPQGAQTVVINETTNNYYYGGSYYEKSGGGYTVVAPTAGTVVESLPEGGEEVRIGDVTYVKYGETYYQPIQQDGKNMYEVVQVEVAS